MKNKAKIEMLLALKKEFDRLRSGKESLLTLIDEVELAESVYNSNAIENSTLTLPDTERILLDLEVSKNYSLREVYEAKNLARVHEYVKKKRDSIMLDSKTILFLHELLIGGIDDGIAGRFREKGEYVRVGEHIAPAPEHVGRLIENLLFTYQSDHTSDILTKVARFHLDFETIHPFVDGNGRVGRVLINLALQTYGYPPVIVRDSEKHTYYKTFPAYRETGSVRGMVTIIYRGLSESLNKRVTYLKGQKIVTLGEYAKERGDSLPGLINAGRRQTNNAFRERGVWKIGV